MENRKTKKIAFLVSFIATIGILFATVGKPHYMNKKCFTKCDNQEIKKNTD